MSVSRSDIDHVLALHSPRESMVARGAQLPTCVHPSMSGQVITPQEYQDWAIAVAAAHLDAGWSRDEAMQTLREWSRETSIEFQVSQRISVRNVVDIVQLVYESGLHFSCLAVKALSSEIICEEPDCPAVVPHSAFEYLSQILQGLGAVHVSVPTFSPQLNALLNGGLRGGKIVGFAAPAGVGKSALLNQIADSIAEHSIDRVSRGLRPVPVYYVSIEMPAIEHIQRSLARIAPMNCATFERGGMTEVEQDAVRRAALHYEPQSRFVIFEKGQFGLRPSFVAYRINQVRARYGLSLSDLLIVIIDPFQRLHADPTEGESSMERVYANEVENIGRVTSQLKGIAEEKNVCLLLASDTTKSATKATGTGEEGFRGTYMVNHVADVTIFLRTSTDICTAAGERTPSCNDCERCINLDGRQFYNIARRNRLPSNAPNDPLCSEYLVGRVSKNRSGQARDLVFIFEKAIMSLRDINP